MADEDRDDGADASLEPPTLRPPSLSLGRFRRGKRGAEPTALDDAAPGETGDAAAHPDEELPHQYADQPYVDLSTTGTLEQPDDADPATAPAAPAAPQISTGAHAAEADHQIEPVAAFPDESPAAGTHGNQVFEADTADPGGPGSEQAHGDRAKDSSRFAFLSPILARLRRANPRQGSWAVVGGRGAAVVTGLLVGALLVVLTALGLQLCDVVRGTPSCGGPGFFLLLAILAVAILAGATLLRLLRVSDPGSTSFLAVGLTTVIALLFLVNHLDSLWMILVIPLITVGTYLASYWVTTTFVEPDPEVRPRG